MKKAEFIARYGEDAYKKKLEQDRARLQAWRDAHPKERKEHDKTYRETNPEKVKANSREGGHKGGKYYEKKLIYHRTGLPGEKNKIRRKHNKEYKPYKDIIAPESQIHHEWIPQTAEYNGLALVETNPHQHGFIDVILLLDGEITLLTEEDVKMGRGIKV